MLVQIDNGLEWLIFFGRELGRYGTYVAALSKTHLAEFGEIKEVVVGYTFFWSRRKSEERRKEGVCH